MRISDWSSDVCSSDLPAMRAYTDFRASGPAQMGTDAFRRTQEALATLAEKDLSLARELAGECAAAVPLGEIGRASCRERVCQYVLISVVAVSVTKNKADIIHQNNTINNACSKN